MFILLHKYLAYYSLLYTYRLFLNPILEYFFGFFRNIIQDAYYICQTL